MMFFLFQFWWKPQHSRYQLLSPRSLTSCEAAATALTDTPVHAGTQRSRAVSHPRRGPPWLSFLCYRSAGVSEAMRGRRGEGVHTPHAWAAPQSSPLPPLPFRGGELIAWLGAHADKLGNVAPLRTVTFQKPLDATEREARAWVGGQTFLHPSRSMET